MKTRYTVALAMLAGFGLGAVAVQGLHAQAKSPVYQITEIEMLDATAYVRDYVPRAQAAIKGAGGRFLAAGGIKQLLLQHRVTRPAGRVCHYDADAGYRL